MKILIITLALVLGFRIGELYAAGGGGHGGGGPKAPRTEATQETGAASRAEDEGSTDSPHAFLTLKFSLEGSSLT